MNAFRRARQDIRSALRRRRRALGLTQEQAGRLLGMHRLTYHRPLMREVHDAARAKGVQLHILEARTEGEINAAFATLAQLRVSAPSVLEGLRDRLQVLTQVPVGEKLQHPLSIGTPR
jgi:hypothetical protein